MTIARYSVGTGDRFGREGQALVAAFQKLKDVDGVDADIVFNKSNREHTIIGTSPADQRANADAAVAASGWQGKYYVDADHIGMANVDWFIGPCDFWTIDVTNVIGTGSEQAEADEFLARAEKLLGDHEVPGAGRTVSITPELLQVFVEKYLFAMAEAQRIFEHIREAGAELRHVEVAMDESPEIQGPAELLIVLSEIAHRQIPADTVAVKFSGRFNKGIDYVGDVEDFLDEFRADVAVIGYGIEKFGLKPNLKISVHTGSDKFSLYPGMGRIVRELGTGIHLKTAGTTWLEELIGLAEGGDEGLAIGKEIYRTAYGMYDELAAPYADVIDIDPAALPSPDEVDGWTAKQFVSALRHDQSNPAYDKNFRQLLHVSFKLAAKMGQRYLDALATYREDVERNVTENIYDRHLKPLFVD